MYLPIQTTQLFTFKCRVIVYRYSVYISEICYINNIFVLHRSKLSPFKVQYI